MLHIMPPIGWFGGHSAPPEELLLAALLLLLDDIEPPMPALLLLDAPPMPVALLLLLVRIEPPMPAADDELTSPELLLLPVSVELPQPENARSPRLPSASPAYTMILLSMIPPKQIFVGSRGGVKKSKFHAPREGHERSREPLRHLLAGRRVEPSKDAGVSVTDILMTLDLRR